MTETKQAWPALAEASYEVAVEMVEEVAVVVTQKIAECDTSFLADLQALNFAIEQWNASRDPGLPARPWLCSPCCKHFKSALPCPIRSALMFLKVSK